MKRLTLPGLMCLLVGFAAATRFGQCVLGEVHGQRSTTAGQFYVIVEKADLDVMCVLYASMQGVRGHAAGVKNRNNERKLANTVIEKELKKLRADLAKRGRQLAQSEDPDRKAELEKEIEALKSQIAEKEAERRPLIKLIGPKRFGSREAAERYMEAVYTAADKAREKAQAKDTDA